MTIRARQFARLCRERMTAGNENRVRQQPEQQQQAVQTTPEKRERTRV